MTRNGSKNFHTSPVKIKVGKGIKIKQGRDVSIFVSGGLLYLAFDIADYLKKHGVDAAIISMPTVKPVDRELILSEAKNKKAIFSLEEHSIIGGLGTAIAETLIDEGAAVKFLRFGMPDKFLGITGSIPYLLSVCGLTKEKIGGKIVSILKD